MGERTMGMFAVAMVIGVLAYGLWYQTRYPRQILRTGAITIEAKRPQGMMRMTLKTRDIQIRDTVFQEVEMPNGTWIDCAGDCRRAATEAGDGLWEKIDRERR
jgi:hypothetical protein